MKLKEIMKGVSLKNENIPDRDISDIVYDSRKASPEVIFVCLTGAFADGHDYALSAYEKGCRTFLCSKEVGLPADALVLYTENTRKALAAMSCSFFRNPSRELKVIGITGTKGKTTVAHLVRSVLEKGGVTTGIIGTVGAFYGETSLPTVNTTPESYELQKMLRQMADGGCKAVAMEVSSLGLKHHRVEGTEFYMGVFTNLYPDHIGTNEHETFEEYAYWKRQLFPMCRKAIVNIDDPFSEKIIESCGGEVITYGLSNSADYVLEDTEKVRLGSVLAVKMQTRQGARERTYTVAMPGEVNAHNAMIAVACGRDFGVSEENIALGLEQVRVKGRCELVREIEDFTLIIDYAHNGVSLKSIIDTARGYEHNRIITLFGSVGGRTECRREELGTVSGKMSDFTVITSDDPDYEDPEKICREIAFYCEKAGGKYTVIPDRGEAIHYAVNMAQKGDILILAGKGHENFMKIRGKKLPFSEKEEALDAYSKKKEG